MARQRGLRWPSPRALRWAGVLLSLGALALLVVLLANGDLTDLIRPLAAARLEWLGAALAAALAVEVVKTVRWQLLLGIETARLPQLLALVFNARVLNALAPLRAGDFWRIAFVTRVERRHLVTSGGSVLLEKAFDGAALGGIGLVVLGTSAPDRRWLLLPAVALAAGFGLALAARRPAIRAQLERWIAELGHLRRGCALVGVVLLTVAGLGLGLLANLAVLRALELPASLTVGLVMLLSGYAAGVLPSAPARIGVFELAVATPLIASGLDPSESVAAAIALHLVLLATLAVGGLFALALGALDQLKARAAAEPRLVGR